MEREGDSSTKNRAWPKNDFTDLVCSWALDDVFDENLYKNQVENIPQTFQSVEHYLGSYISPLLEETRAQLASGMEIIHRAPFAEVVTIEGGKPYGSSLYNVKVDCWRNRLIERGRELYKTLPGDIVVISDSKPETISDLQRMNFSWTFGTVTGIEGDEIDDNSTSTNFKVKASRDVEVMGDKKSLYVVFLINITTHKRIWNALHMVKNLQVVEKVLSYSDRVEEYCELCSVNHKIKLCEKIGSGLLTQLNESQTEAVMASLHRLTCDHRSCVELIWGPPGTGKTRTISVLLFALLRMNYRTLSCAPTNVAVTEVAYRVIKLAKESFNAEYAKGDVLSPLGDILLFGNKDRLKVGSDIEEIYLNYRVKRLVECLSRLTGWKHCMISMIDFLEDCLLHYHIFVKNELSKMKEQKNEDEVQKTKPLSLLEFSRARFKALLPPLRRCVITFCTHVPRSFILEKNFENMVHLICRLETLEMMLFQEIVTSDQLEELYSSNVMMEDCSKACMHTSSLMCTRSQCMFILKSLRSSLEKLDLPLVVNENSVREFCFKMASLIFCTASSSYKLHLIDMEPLNVLVIDEAAQLKECESLIPLQVSGLRHAILVGDERQLPATIKSETCNEAGFGRSLFERLSFLGHSKYLLNVQYRMHPSISLFPNSKLYLNKILDAPNVQSKSYEKCYLPERMFGPYSFINVLGGKEERDEDGHSLRNMVEAALVIKIVQKLFKVWKGSNAFLSIGVISPYAAQVALIQDNLRQKYENLEKFVVKVKSVDGCQGGEEDIIIISTVRANNVGSIGFLSNPLRTNVALTRARHCLWILGNAKTLTNSHSIWEALICDAQDRECFFTADEDNDLSKTILDVKKELDQLEDLLNGDSVLFRRGRWKVIFSDNFRKSFGKLNSTYMKKSVINLLLKLASGWRPKKKKVDSVCESSSQIVKQFKVEGLYVVCSIDIMKESMYKQVLKVWDILSLEEMPKLLRRLDSIFSMHTDDFIVRCKEKCLEGELEVPKSWPTSSVLIRYKNLNGNNIVSDSGDSTLDGRYFVENSRVSESLLLMKFYSLSTGVVNHLLSDRDGGELDLPFEVTDEELEIIQFCRSSFILGRSGTGKTTVLTMKLFQKEQIYHLALQGITADKSSIYPSVRMRAEVDDSIEYDGGSSLRQLFVTVSPRLCYAVKQHVSQLKSFAYGGNLSSEISLINVEDGDGTADFKDIPDSFVGIPAKKYPLVITFHKFLMMLDGTMADSYFGRFPEIREFSNDNNRSLRSIALQTFVRMKEVNYDSFCFLYWPHFNAQLTKNLDCSRVFTEIISHIKGGLLAGAAPDGRLSRQEYVSMSESRASTLSAQKREMIYEIFQDYEKMKVDRGEFDLSDFVIDLHHRLKNESLDGDKMDFVYIDEVQDLTMRQIALFKYICSNIDEGFVFSGDTAQTIARGIDFRFEDIRSLFYNEFVMESKNETHTESKEKGRISEIFNLHQNFRTHAGVLRLAQSVIDLLYHFFRQSVDFLKPETSLIYGEAPVLLEHGSEENAVVTIFGNRASSCSKVVGFGAEQVILVRDDSAREEVSNYVGNQALVLTIVECKGLEFQDVLLYNFFGSSPLRNQWRVVYEFMNEKDLLDSSLPKCFPSFSHARHSILCSELKQLYVAITRTRQRLWICENKEEFSKPMFDFWKKLYLVQVKKVDDSFAQAMQVASSPAEWKSRGVKLYWEKKYQMATMCFEKAGDTNWEKRAKAAGLRTTADQLRGSNPKEACTILREAAEIFDSIGRADSAAECFCDLGEYERAGRIYLEKCGESELKKAGDCFNLAGCYELAAEVYAKGNFFTDCLSVCTKGKLFELGLRYIELWKLDSPCDNGRMTGGKEIDKIEQDFLESCALSYYELKDNKSMMRYVRAFPCMDFKRNFLKSVDCFDELLLLEEESGNFKEAAEIAKLRGDLLREADLLGKAGHLKEASVLILSFVLSNSLWVAGSRGWPLKSFAGKDVLLKKAMSFAKQVSDQFYELVCTEVQVLSDEHINLHELHDCLSYSQRHRSVRSEMLSIRMILDAHFHVKALNYLREDELPVDVKKLSADRLLLNQASVGTLMYFWNLWKENMSNIFQYLEGMENQHFSTYTGFSEYCLNYFGVRRQVNFNVIYVLLNPDAEWAKKTDFRPMRQSKNLVSIDARKFAYAARSHWRAELTSVGLKVLETLEALHKLSITNSVSLFCQSMCLIHIYQVTKFLIESLECTESLARKLRTFLQLSTKYFENVFPLDCRKSLVENMISLRKTELSCTLLDEVIVENISRKGELTYGQIGRVVMIWLGCGKQTDELYKKMADRIDENSPWKAFIEVLSGNKVSESRGGSSSKDSASCRQFDSLQVFSSSDSVHCILESRNGDDPASNISVEDPNKFSLTAKLYDALKDTYLANWRAKDYMAPNSFLYLVERLLILVCHSKDFFFTTKYSFLEWLMHLQSDMYPSASSVSAMQLSPEIVYDYLVTMVQRFLCNGHETAEWIEKSNIDFAKYYPLLLLRLMVVMCLLCLNSGKYFDVFSRLLDQFHISSQLPRQFVEALRQGKKRNFVNVNHATAAAFMRIGDPIVIVRLRGNILKFVSPHAIFIDIAATPQKDNIMGILFPKATSCHGQSSTVEANEPNLCKGLPRSESFLPSPDLNTSSKRCPGNQQIKWALFEEISDVLISTDKRQDGDLTCDLLKIKVELKETIKVLAVGLNVQKAHPVGNGNLFGEVSSMLQELKEISSLFDASRILSAKNTARIGILLMSLQSRRPELESFINQLTVPNEAGPRQVSDAQGEDEVDTKMSTVGNLNDIPSTPVASGSQSNDQSNASERNQGKGKNKKRSKKGKRR